MRKQDTLILAGIAVVVAGIVFSSSLRGKGTLAVETQGAELQVRTGWFSTATVTSGAGPAQVQAGIHHPAKASIRLKKDDGGKSWSLASSSRGPWGTLASIRVDKGQTTTLQFGPPITLHTDVQQNGRTVSVGLTLIGQAGEHWSPQVMTSEGPAAPPSARIVDESGTTLAEGQFAYG